MNDFNAQHKENSKQRKIQYTVVYVETLNWETMGIEIPYIREYTDEKTNYNTLRAEYISHSGLLASTITQLWRRSHTLSLSLSRSLSIHSY